MGATNACRAAAAMAVVAGPPRPESVDQFSLRRISPDDATSGFVPARTKIHWALQRGLSATVKES